VPGVRSRRGLVAWIWVILATAAVAAAIAGGEPARAQDDGHQQQVARGEDIFTRQCASCHSITGGEADAPDLRQVSVPYADLVLRTQRMPPGDRDGRTKGDVRYSDEDREAIVAYLTEQFGLEGEIPEPAEGDPARGREIFATHCAACHGSTGAGGVAGGGAITPNLIGLDGVTLAQAIRVGPFQMPRFSSDQISDEGLGDIAAFMHEVAEEPGTLLGFAELNPVFASAFVFALSIIVLLSCMWITGRVQLFPDRRDDEEEAA
jgi:ubiquinol-cytochrome c reductase cytochrome c subunit